MTEAESFALVSQRRTQLKFVVLISFCADFASIILVPARVVRPLDRRVLLHNRVLQLCFRVPIVEDCIVSANLAIFDRESDPSTVLVIAVHHLLIVVLTLDHHLREVLVHLLLVLLSQHSLYALWVEVDDARHLVPYLEDLI